MNHAFYRPSSIYTPFPLHFMNQFIFASKPTKKLKIKKDLKHTSQTTATGIRRRKVKNKNYHHHQSSTF